MAKKGVESQGGAPDPEDQIDSGMSYMSPEELDTILAEEEALLESVDITDRVHEDVSGEVAELQDRAEEAEVNEEEQAEIDELTENLSGQVQEEKVGFAKEFVDVKPDVLDKRVQEAATFLQSNEGATKEDLIEEFALDNETAGMYLSLAQTFGKKKEAPEEVEGDSVEEGVLDDGEQQEDVDEESVDEEPRQEWITDELTEEDKQKMEQVGEALRNKEVQEKVQAENQPEQEEQDVTEDKKKINPAVRKAQMRGQAEKRHLNRSAEEVGGVRFERAVRNRVRNMAEGFNGLLATKEMSSLMNSLFGSENTQAPRQIDAGAVSRFAGKLTRKKGGLFGFFKKTLGLDKKFMNIGKKIVRSPLTAAYTVGAKVDDVVSAGARYVEKPVATFRLHRAQVQERAAMKRLESGRNIDPERVQAFINKVREMQKRLNRVNMPVSERDKS